MEVIVMDRVEMPPENNVWGFPQYLLCRLLEQGPALLEAEITDAKVATAGRENIEWRFSPRVQVDRSPPIIRSDWRRFRPTLASFGNLCGISPYGGHTLFQIRFTDQEKPEPERFAIYLCNEPTMGFWIRLYLYGIDGAFPNYGGMYDKKPDSAPSEA